MSEQDQPPAMPTEAELDALVQHFQANRSRISTFLNQILVIFEEAKPLADVIHSIRHRIKDPDHLKDKLRRKAIKAAKREVLFDITKENLFTKVNDLAGIRILHLHTQQVAEIDAQLKHIFNEEKLTLVEGPFARTWDDENRAFFKDIGIETQDSSTMYTSVHYVIASNSRTTVTCEIQVRTLMEEVWGEVDHKINYPHPVDSVACREQIRTLARATSTATRLVDSIFATVADFRQQKGGRKA